MIEIPESLSLSLQLNNTIKGKTIKNVCVNSTPHKLAWFYKDPNNYNNLLTNKKVDYIESIAGFIEISVEDVKILFSDGVTIRYYSQNDKSPNKYQLLIEFTDESSLVCNIQMYGGLWVFPEGEFDNHYYLLAKEKPSPLSEEFDFEYFNNLFNKYKDTKLSAKAFLATEQRIPGLGNGVLQDILFIASINPKRKINTLNDNDVNRLYRSIKLTLIEMAEQRGRNTEKDIFGNSGSYKTIMSKLNDDSKCPNCRSSLIKEAYLGGSVYYCPKCQILE